ncbi:hypothetical protein [Paenibacillus sp. FSL L8-0506]|uniref:hypothetical protein n=1 Tax=Paenibacillus sp. FSL L8-0506 TaxID=2975335 RepID=UPI0030FA25CB
MNTAQEKINNEVTIRATLSEIQENIDNISPTKTYRFEDFEGGYYKVNDFVVTVIKLPAGGRHSIKATASFKVTSTGGRSGQGGRHETSPPFFKIFFENSEQGVLDQFRSDGFFKLIVRCGDNQFGHYYESHNTLDFFNDLAFVNAIIEKHAYYEC